jgi:hypothetical protein
MRPLRSSIAMGYDPAGFSVGLSRTPTLVTFTGAVGKIFNFPLRLIIAACVRLRIHPNILTFTGVLINIWAGWHLARGEFLTAFWIMLGANVFEPARSRSSAGSGIR